MSDTKIFVEAGLRIRALRGSETQSAFAARLGVNRKTVERWESGERLPEGQSLLALMTVCGADVNYLLSGQRDTVDGPVDSAEQVLLTSYRRCNAQARQNLIQTAALLAAGLPVEKKTRSTKSNESIDNSQHSVGDNAIQIGSVTGKARIKNR